jgi:hypothetical protein
MDSPFMGNGKNAGGDLIATAPLSLIFSHAGERWKNKNKSLCVSL